MANTKLKTLIESHTTLLCSWHGSTPFLASEIEDVKEEEVIFMQELRDEDSSVKFWHLASDKRIEFTLTYSK